MSTVAAAEDQSAAAAVRIYDDVPPPPSAPPSVSSGDPLLLQQQCDSSNLTKHDDQVSQPYSTSLPLCVPPTPPLQDITNSSHCVHVNTDNDLSL